MPVIPQQLIPVQDIYSFGFGKDLNKPISAGILTRDTESEFQRPENTIIYDNDGGHNHDGINSRLISPYKCSLYNSTNQNVLTGTPTDINWDTKLYDAMGMASSTGLVTIPIDGFYHIALQYDWGSVVGAGLVQGVIYEGTSVGAINTYLTYITFPHLSASQNTSNCSAVVYLTKGKNIRSYAFQSSGLTITVNGGNAASRSSFLTVTQLA